MVFLSTLTAIIAYLLGNVNGAVIMSKLLAREDVRKHGSGNAGLTNYIRNYGAASSVAVIAIDAGKALLACFIGGLILGSRGYEMEGRMLAGVFVMLGHDFPALLDFKGGKGILSGFMVALMVDWRVGLAIFVVFAVVYLVTQYVSLGSVLAAATFAVGFACLHYTNPWIVTGGTFLGALTIWMHRENIQRLLAGEERKTNLFKGKEKKK